MSDTRCEHDVWLGDRCSLCEEEKQPSSTEARLLTGSIAQQELAALRKKLHEYANWMEKQARTGRGAGMPQAAKAYEVALNKLGEIMEAK
jgi:hypothetical protein